MARYKVMREFGVDIAEEHHGLGKSFDTDKLSERHRKEIEKAVEKGEIAEDYDVEADVSEFDSDMAEEVAELQEKGFVIDKDEPETEAEESESDAEPKPKKKGKKLGKGK